MKNYITLLYKTSQTFCTQLKTSKYASSKIQANLGSQHFNLEEKNNANVQKLLKKCINFRKFSQSKHYSTM